MNRISAILQSLGFSYGQTDCQFPNNARPFSLVTLSEKQYAKEKGLIKKSVKNVTEKDIEQTLKKIT